MEPIYFMSVEGFLYTGDMQPGDRPATEAETAALVAAARTEEIKGALDGLDLLYLTPRVIAGLALGDAYALEQWRKHEAEAEPLRAALAALGG